VRTFAGSKLGLIAGYETEGTIYHSPIPGKLKVLTSDDLETWREMTVDYRAVAHRAMIAGPDEKHLLDRDRHGYDSEAGYHRSRVD